MVAVDRVETQGRAVLEVAKVGPQALALEAEPREVAEQLAVAADQAEVFRITRFLPKSDL